MTTPSQDAYAELEAQGALAAGSPGWWKVWGASPQHIRPGDLVLSKVAGGDVEPTLVAELFTAKAAPLRLGVVTAEGERVTFGALNTIVLLRQGTRNTLA